MSTVRLLAVNELYRTVPYFAVPIYDEEKKKWRPDNEDFKAISSVPVRRKPDPEKQYPLSHQDNFDKSKPDDVFLLALAKLQPLIAPNSKSVIKSKHLFYLQDVEEEAKTEVKSMDKIFEAMKLIKENASVSTMRDLAIYLGLNPSDSMMVIQGRVYKYLNENPQAVLNYFSNTNSSRLMVKKAIYYSILKNKGGIFYDHDRLIGRDEAEVELFVRDAINAPLVAKWSLEIERVENKANPGADETKIPIKRKSAQTVKK